MGRRHFIKMEGLGNDYIYFDCRETPFPDPAEQAPRLADRHFGIGGDGIVLILPSRAGDYRMEMYNADGSRAEMCGNAIRCVGKYLFDTGITEKTELDIETGCGIRHIRLHTESGSVTAVCVDMGEPVLKGPEIPTSWDLSRVVDEPLNIGGEELRVTCVSMGNPHCVVFTDRITDHQVLELGPRIETNSHFPNRTNVEFATVFERDEIRMRVWERGTGETMACGTGACAVGVAAVLNELADSRTTVHLNGGDLEIEWAGDGHVYMTGPAEFVFEGEVEIDDGCS